MSKICVINSIVVNSNKIQSANVFIENGKISKIGNSIDLKEEDVIIIDAKNKYLLPGGIDPHVHLNLKTKAGYSCDDFYSGTKAALAGGTTTIIDFVTPDTREESLIQALKKRKEEAENAICNYAFHMSPLSWNESVASELEKCVKEEGISSFKTYMAYKAAIGLDTDIITQIMHKIASLDGIMLVHAELGEVVEDLQNQLLNEGKTTPKYHAESRPANVEEEAVKNIIEASMQTGCAVYIVHVSSGRTIELIQEAQKKGVPIFAETCPQYLLFDKSELDKPFYEAAPFVFSPALHEKHHKNQLWKGIENNIINTIGTDHCPFNLYGQKDLGINDFTQIPNGTGGVEHRLELLYTFGVLQNRISLQQMVDISSTQPAKIFGLQNKGIIKIGYDADLVIWNPETTKTISVENHMQNCDNNIYSGIEVKGKAETVILNGEIVYSSNNGYTNSKGKYIYRKMDM